MSRYKATGKQTLFDAEKAAQKLSETGNPLEAAVVNHNTKSNAGVEQ